MERQAQLEYRHERMAVRTAGAGIDVVLQFGLDGDAVAKSKTTLYF
ncbi:MAG: hypothetical protein ACP5I8_10265 [Phycisphaerae bacterium]